MFQKMRIALSYLVIPATLLAACGNPTPAPPPRLPTPNPTNTLQAGPAMFASWIKVDLDSMIDLSALIVIGQVETIYPSRWRTADGKLPEGVSVADVPFEYMPLITDMEFHIDQVLKGEWPQSTVRVRTFGGEYEGFLLPYDGERTMPPLEIGPTYLLFLEENTARTGYLGPEHYLVIGGLQGMFTIANNRATSIDYDFALEDLLAYIAARASQTATPTPTPAELNRRIWDMAFDLAQVVARYSRRGEIELAVGIALWNQTYDTLLDDLYPDARFNRDAAIEHTNEFLNLVAAHRGAKIPEAIADDLTARAQAILTLLLSLTPTPMPTGETASTFTETPQENLTPTPTLEATPSLTETPQGTPTE